ALADDYVAGYSHNMAVRDLREACCGSYLPAIEFGAAVGHRMAADGHSRALAIGFETLFDGHLLQRRFWRGLGDRTQQIADAPHCTGGLPQAVAAVRGADRVQR